jgi:DNA repair exonuclease SbcCD ATPase subunit
MEDAVNEAGQRIGERLMSDESTGSVASGAHAKRTRKRIDKDLEEIDRQVAALEAEKAGMPAPVTWDELQEAGTLRQVEQAELRRGVIPRMLRAARVKRLQLELERLEKRLAPIIKEQEESYERREELKAQIQELEALHGQAQGAWSHASMRRDTIEREQRSVRKQLRELEGEN